MGRKFTLKCHIVFCVKYRKRLLSKVSILQTDKDTILSSGYFVCSTGDASTETIAKYIAEQG